VNQRPSGSGIELLIRYVTRASERFGVRNSLYQRVIELLHKENTETPTEESRSASGLKSEKM
jgi:hypothetical protein